MKITSEFIKESINRPRNAINIEANAHDFFDDLSWGIEAVLQPGGSVSIHSLVFRSRLSGAHSIAISTDWFAIQF